MSARCPSDNRNRPHLRRTNEAPKPLRHAGFHGNRMCARGSDLPLQGRGRRFEPVNAHVKRLSVFGVSELQTMGPLDSGPRLSSGGGECLPIDCPFLAKRSTV